jgi:hypothetical protein
MAKSVSTGNMIEKLGGMLGTKDLGEWEQKFVFNMCEAKDEGKVGNLTDKQVESLERIYNKHFG